MHFCVSGLICHTFLAEVNLYTVTIIAQCKKINHPTFCSSSYDQDSWSSVDQLTVLVYLSVSSAGYLDPYLCSPISPINSSMSTSSAFYSEISEQWALPRCFSPHDWTIFWRSLHFASRCSESYITTMHFPRWVSHEMISRRFHRLHCSPPSLMPYISGLDTFAVIYTLHYIHTLPIELRSIWSRRLTGTSVLFLLNRHGFMLSQILNTIGDFPGNIGQFPCVALRWCAMRWWNSRVQQLTTDNIDAQLWSLQLLPWT